MRFFIYTTFEGNSVILAVVGFFGLLFSNKRKFIFVFLLFVTCVAYSINYDIHDIDSYFLLAFIATALFTGFGFLTVIERIKFFQQKYILAGTISFLVIIQLVQNWNSVDQSENFLVEDYAKNILNNLPSHSIILSYQWDYFVSASYYFQHVKNYRSDVVVLDKELFRRSWYFSQLDNMYPLLMEKSKRESQHFLNELYKFEYELPYNYNAIEGRYAELLKSFMVYNLDSVNFYVTPEIEQNYTAGFNRIPDGFVYRLVRDTSYIPTNFPKFVFRDFKGESKYALQIKRFSATVLVQRGLYEQRYGRDSLAGQYFAKASLIPLN